MRLRTLSQHHNQPETDRALWGFFLLVHNKQTQMYRLVSCQPDVQLWRNPYFQTEDDDLEKCILKLHRTATIKPRQIERSVVLFLLDYNRQTRVYRLVSGQPDVRMWRNRNFPTEEEDCIPHLRYLGLICLLLLVFD